MNATDALPRAFPARRCALPSPHTYLRDRTWRSSVAVRSFVLQFPNSRSMLLPSSSPFALNTAGVTRVRALWAWRAQRVCSVALWADERAFPSSSASAFSFDAPVRARRQAFPATAFCRLVLLPCPSWLLRTLARFVLCARCGAQHRHAYSTLRRRTRARLRAACRRARVDAAHAHTVRARC